MTQREHPLDRAYRRFVTPMKLGDDEHAWLARNFQAIRHIRPMPARRAYVVEPAAEARLSWKAVLVWGAIEIVMSQPALLLVVIGLPTIVILALVAHVLFGTANPFGSLHHG